MRRLHYTYPVNDLFTGSSLGNRFMFAQLDAQTNLKGLWSSSDNQFYAGEWSVAILVNTEPLIATETHFSPESQTTVLTGKELTAEKRFFLPYASDREIEPGPASRVGVYLVQVKNTSTESITFSIQHSIIFPAVPSEFFIKKPPEKQTWKRVAVTNEKERFVIVTEGKPQEVRVFWSRLPPDIWSADNSSLKAEYHIILDAGETIEITFLLATSPAGVADAMETVESARDGRSAVEKSGLSYDELLARTLIFTPDPLINRGLQWAKVNTARVQHRYRSGLGFTNDPPQDIIVMRDLGWYVLGSDYLTPGFSRSLLDLAGAHGVHEGGKVTEYIHADEEKPERHDYNLNINDDTPLLIYGLYHHAVSTGDEVFLRHAYPLMKQAGEWILAQRSGDLVRCVAEGTGVRGICGWRNIIEGYTLNGAVTEINVECAFVLSLLAKVAGRLGENDDATRYEGTADALTRAIHAQLVSEKTGLYLLNIGNDGVRHHDVTGDLIFPVLFGLAPEVMRRRILDRLTGGEFWTPYGTRTVSPREKNYDPDFGYQLVGGVWPNLTAWTAYCIRKDDPDRLVEGMLNTYRMSETKRPADFVNVVPGEFPERLNGETFVSRGMTMSPWMPPTYLWLGVEGLLGVKPTLDDLEINPVIPPRWKWVAVRDLICKGEKITAFLYEGTLYTSYQVQSEFPVRVATPVPVATDNESLFAIAMTVEEEVLLFVAADELTEGIVRVDTVEGEIVKDVRLLGGEAVLLRIPLIPAVKDASTAKAVP